MSSGLQTPWGDLDKTRLWVLMPMASLTIRAIFYPTTLVKTRLQASTAYRGTADAFKTIWRTEGPLALYKGFSVSLLGLFIGPVYISTLESSKSWLTERLPRNSTTQALIPMAAGAYASAVGQTLSVPVDIVSQRRMMQTSEGSSGSGTATTSALEVVAALMKEGGPRAFYRGYGVSLLTYVPSSSIIWGVVHHVQAPLARLWPPGPGPPPPSAAPTSRWDGAVRDTCLCMLSGAIAGATSAVLLNPMDVLRTRIQVLDANPGERPSLRETARALVQERGLLGFGAGVTARVLSLAPLFSLIIGGYELIKRGCVKGPLAPADALIHAQPGGPSTGSTEGPARPGSKTL